MIPVKLHEKNTVVIASSLEAIRIGFGGFCCVPTSFFLYPIYFSTAESLEFLRKSSHLDLFPQA